MHYISLEYYARFVDIKISEHSGDTQVSSREDIEKGACRSVESSKLIFFSEIHFYQKFKMHSLKVNNAIYNANCATMPDVQLFLLINYFLKTKPGKVQNWHRVKQCHFARRLMYIKSNTVIHIQSDHSG